MLKMLSMDQVKSAARAAANWGAGFLVAHGVISTGSTETFVGVAVGIAALVWGHFTHADA